MNLVAAIHAQALDTPEAPALVVGKQVRATYRDLSERVTRLAAWIAASPGWAERPRLALLTENHPAFFEVLLACWHAGGAAAPINAKLHPREIAEILEDTRPALFFTSAKLLGAAQAALRGIAAPPLCLNLDGEDFGAACVACEPLPMADACGDAVAWLFFTSGTTGRSKGAQLTHQALMAMSAAYYADIAAVTPADRFIHLAPVSHGSGLYALPFLMKGAANVLPASGGFEVAEALELVAGWPRATTFLAPTMLNRLIAHDGAAVRLRAGLETLVYGGGPMYLADLERALHAIGPCLTQIYGQGETPMTITALSRRQHAEALGAGDLARLGSVGTPRFGIEVRVVDPGGRALPDGEIGEVVVRGPTVMAGYLNNAEATAGALQDGWLRTGDIGAFRAGYLSLHDRSKDVIISGGSNIYPREVEEVLLGHPEVMEAAVVGLPDAEWGEIVACAYSTRAGEPLHADELDAHCLERIARFKRPKRYAHVAQLPKTSYGKVPKRLVLDLFAARRRPA